MNELRRPHRQYPICFGPNPVATVSVNRPDYSIAEAGNPHLNIWSVCGSTGIRQKIDPDKQRNAKADNRCQCAEIAKECAHCGSPLIPEKTPCSCFVPLSSNSNDKREVHSTRDVPGWNIGTRT
jgi:hypothetical protein